MISYSEREMFCANDVRLLNVAEHLVGKINEQDFDEEVRCHELARAVGQVMELPHQDGHYLFAQHTWLWVSQIEPEHEERGEYPPILEVYAVGSLPQVQLLDTFPPLNRVGTVYKPGEARTDIRHDVVATLVEKMKFNRGRVGCCRRCEVPTFGMLCAKCAGEEL